MNNISDFVYFQNISLASVFMNVGRKGFDTSEHVEVGGLWIWVHPQEAACSSQNRAPSQHDSTAKLHPHFVQQGRLHTRQVHHTTVSILSLIARNGFLSL